MNRKAMFFTLMAITIMTVLIVTFRATDYMTLVNRVPVIKGRVEQANQYVKDIKSFHMERSLFVSSKKGIRSYINRTVHEGFQDEEEMEETLENYIKKNESTEIVMNDLIEDVEVRANESLNIVSELNITDIDVFQSNRTGPWRLGFNMSYNFTVEATRATWNSSDNLILSISIKGLRDPFIYLNTDPNINRTIKKVNYSQMGREALHRHIDESNYIYTNSSPSFLHRLTNNTNGSDCCGIESMINTSRGFKVDDADLSYHATDIGYRNESFVDYCYITDGDADKCQTGLYMVNETSSDYYDENNFTYPFRVDTYHFNIFNLSSLPSEEYDSLE